MPGKIEKPSPGRKQRRRARAVHRAGGVHAGGPRRRPAAPGAGPGSLRLSFNARLPPRFRRSGRRPIRPRVQAECRSRTARLAV